MKKVLVTGSLGSLGSEICKGLVDQGYYVIGLDLNENNLEINNYSHYKIDLTDFKHLEKTLSLILEEHKTVDILINNAGALYNEPIINITSSQRRHSFSNWNKIIDLNLNSPFLISAYIAENMVINRIKGVIINISSISARGNAGQSAYSASKAALESLTKVWAKELGPFGIRSVAISPGFIDTKSTHEAVNDTVLYNLKKNTPIRRFGEASDIVQTVLFIIDNNFINSTVVDVDGGLVI